MSPALALIASLTVFGADPAVASASPRADSEASDPPLRWGVALGLAGRATFGDGIRPAGSGVDEYARSDLDLAVEVFALRLGRWVELAPYFAVRLAGGVEDGLFRDAVEAANEANAPDEPDTRVTGTNDLELGLGARVFPVRWGGFEPYVGVFGGYARTSVSIAPEGDGGGPFATIPVASHAREGLSLSGAIGARYGWRFDALTAPRLFVAAEARYTRELGLGLDSSFEERVAASDRTLDRLGGIVWLGYQL